MYKSLVSYGATSEARCANRWDRHDKRHVMDHLDHYDPYDPDR